ncbi:hypothetical protein B2G94_09975 [Staphylococcus hominis subsp. hominis]|uniref:DUF2951 family protein n=1 Tax=Staphylococcus hominis TaxID=1290 RepID=UPI0008A3AC39|nr:DUF2951 family protein [Staphylococcus hominis]OFU75648.1 hypothetical protein HMPREF3109_07385 [Staphylococcus sp. HMSC10B09]AUJ52968.1 hypothetical protein B7P03_10390 [Staphylococcus hominis subsp. hominis]OUL45070.1 hypothetical protein B2G94_09975 [Staphylococcus hominis subsp. hominis]PJM33479.1 hypothetical protein CWC34_03140 [Staphylococcus hominis]PJM56690.1 hypothetical protein CWB55_03690 [Staphylococcus hominis]
MEDNRGCDYETRIKRLEDNDERIFASLEQIKDGQHNQELINQKMNFTLDSINREREIDKESKRENRKNIKEMKRLMLGMVFSVAGSIIFAVIRMVFGI